MNKLSTTLPNEDVFVFPLSFSQERFWLLEEITGDKTPYNTVGSLHLQGKIDINILHNSVGEIVERHEILRTIFPLIDNSPVQAIKPSLEISLPLINLEDLSDKEQWQEVQSLTFQEQNRKFDLSKGPLLQVTLVKLGETSHVLIVSMHHIICDGWSVNIFINDLSTCYQNLLNGDVLSLPELDIQYADYSQWQRDYMQGAMLQNLLDYWKQKLAQSPPLIDLPTDYPRPSVQSFRGHHYSVTLPKTLLTSIQVLARTNRVTLFTILLTALKILLFKWTRQHDLVVGTVVANRGEKEIENLIGCFVNFLPLRSQIVETETFDSFLEQVSSTVVEAYSHESCPFEKIVEYINPQRELSHNPLYNIALLLHTQSLNLFFSESITATPLSFDDELSELDLRIEAVEAETGLKLQFEYSTDLFQETTIQRLANNFRVLLEQIVANPQQKICDLQILTQSEKYQLLIEFNQTEVEYPLNKCVHELFVEQAEKTPNHLALIFADQQLTYTQLNEKANQLAHYLQTLGVKAETLVGICIERSVEMVIALLGILKAGGAYVPIDPTYPADRLNYMLTDSQVPVLLTQSKMGDQLSKFEGKAIYLDTEWTEIEQYSKTNPENVVTSDNLIYVIYTSGSTGKPKGVMNIHRALVNRLLWMQDMYQLDSNDRVLQKTPFSFDVSVWEFFWTLITGATLVVAKPEGHKDPDFLIDLIQQEKITTLHFVPSMLQVFVEAEEVQKCQDTLKRVICSGEALPYDLQERFFAKLGKCELHNLYGPTEAAIDVSYWQCQAQSSLRKVPIGKPIANTQLYILDPYLQPVPLGVVGELHIAGEGLARGYLNRPELTKEKFIPNPFSEKGDSRLYKTGDLCRFLPDGNIEYIGRIDYQVKIRGFRIELGEIESLLSNHPDVREVVVIVKENESGDKRLVAYLVSRLTNEELEKQNNLTSSLREYLGLQLPEYMIPSAFVWLEQLPLTANGKVDRKALPTPELKQIKTANKFVAPRDLTELNLISIVAEVLKIKGIDVQDNFFELGGNSLLGVQLMAKIQKQFRRKLPLATLFKNPTIEKLAEAIREENSESDWSCLVPIKPNGSKPPLFLIHDASGTVHSYFNLAYLLSSDQPVYALQAIGLDGKSPLQKNVEEMASYYISLIKTIQSVGPYQIAGWSFGGLIAYEVVQQLQKQKQQISFLGLIDTDFPSSKDELPNKGAKILWSVWQSELDFSWESIQELSSEEQLLYVIAEAQKIGLLPRNIPIAEVKSILRVWENNFELCQNYQLKPYSGNVTLFKASEEHSSSSKTNLALDWQNVILGKLEVNLVPGNHHTIIRFPYVQDLVQKLEIGLEKSYQ